MISPVKTGTLIFTILIVITIASIIIIIIIITIIITIIKNTTLVLLPLIIITIIVIRFTGLRVFQHKGKIVYSVLIRENSSQGIS